MIYSRICTIIGNLYSRWLRSDCVQMLKLSWLKCVAIKWVKCVGCLSECSFRDKLLLESVCRGGMGGTFAAGGFLVSVASRCASSSLPSPRLIAYKENERLNAAWRKRWLTCTLTSDACEPCYFGLHRFRKTPCPFNTVSARKYCDMPRILFFSLFSFPSCI